MSAEAPRNSGTGEPFHPQRPDGGFSGFLRRLFGAPSEPHSTQQPISRIIQPPPGLENLANQIQHGLNDLSTAEEHKRQELVAWRISRAERKVTEEQRNNEIREQARLKKEAAAREAIHVMQDFGMADRLKYIRETVWKKGEIRIIEPEFDSRLVGNEFGDRLGGLELIYSFPSFTKEDQEHHSWRYVSVQRNTRLSVHVVDRLWQWVDVPGRSTARREDFEGSKRVLQISSHGLKHASSSSPYPPYYFDFISSVYIPIDAEDSKALLEAGLAQDCIHRVAAGLLPSQIEAVAKKELAESRRNQLGGGGWVPYHSIEQG